MVDRARLQVEVQIYLVVSGEPEYVSELEMTQEQWILAWPLGLQNLEPGCLSFNFSICPMT